MGDFNGKIDQGRCGKIIGSFRLSKRHKRGDQLSTFATEEHGPEQRTISWLPNLRKWFSLTATQLLRTAANKARIGTARRIRCVFLLRKVGAP